MHCNDTGLVPTSHAAGQEQRRTTENKETAGIGHEFMQSSWDTKVT